MPWPLWSWAVHRLTTAQAEVLGRALDKAWLVVSEDKWGKGSLLASAEVLWELSGEA